MKSEDTLRESKSQLAKLMATENIVVEHSAKFKTAMFSPERRILYLPIWKNITEQIYNLFVCHEVSHALNTPRDPIDYWLSQIEPKKPMAARRFLNVVEDARIEKLIKRQYPGIRRSFVEGYKDLIELRNFFGSSGRSYNSYGLVDRINIYFKVGVSAKVIFNEEEQAFVDSIANAETFKEVMVITKELYKYCKEHREESPETTPENYPPEEDEQEESDQSQSDDAEEDEEGDSGPSDEDFPDEDENEEKQDGDEENTGHEDEQGSGEEENGDDGKDSENEDSNGVEGEEDENESRTNDEEKEEGEEKPGENPEAGKSNSKHEDKPKPVIDEPVPCETQENFDQNAGTLNDPNAKDIEYVNIPKVILERIVVPYKEVHNNITKFYSDLDGHYITEAISKFDIFKRKNDKVVSLFHKEFELRKAANISRRVQISKTGKMNTNRIHSYQYNDDIFLSKVTLQDGKNHGLIIFIDFSGSMDKNLRGTIEQLITLILFCRKAQIPFEVYGFGNHYPGNSEVKCQYENRDFFIPEDFKLRQYFHYKMSQREYNEACINMMLLALHCENSILMPPGEALGGTPLNESLVCAFEIIKQFKEATGAQVVHTVVLSDGDANGGLQVYMPGVPHNPRGISWYNAIVIFRDTITRKEYKLATDGSATPITKTLLQMLADRCGVNAIGFYLMAYKYGNELDMLIHKYCGEVEAPKKHQELNDNGFILTNFGGYTEYYLIEGGRKLETSEVNMKKVGRGASTAVLAKQFSEMGTNMRKTRLLATRFTKLIVK